MTPERRKELATTIADARKAFQEEKRRLEAEIRRENLIALVTLLALILVAFSLAIWITS